MIKVWNLFGPILMLGLIGTQVRAETTIAPSLSLTYSSQAPFKSNSLLLKSVRGTYRLMLVPDLDISKHVVVLELVLQRIGSRKGSNLLEPSTQWHGYQPFVFIASDFAKEVEKSQEEGVRVFALSHLGLNIRVKVKKVKVGLFSPSQSHEAGYKFEDLVLNVESQNCSEIAR